MNQETALSQEPLPSYWSVAFDRQYGDVLRQILLELYSTDSSEVEQQADLLREQDSFYYKLAVLTRLVDTNAPTPTPSKELAGVIKKWSVASEDFYAFNNIARGILKHSAEAASFLTPEILAMSERVIADISLVSFYYNFSEQGKTN